MHQVITEFWRFSVDDILRVWSSVIRAVGQHRQTLVWRNESAIDICVSLDICKLLSFSTNIAFEFPNFVLTQDCDFSDARSPSPFIPLQAWPWTRGFSRVQQIRCGSPRAHLQRFIVSLLTAYNVNSACKISSLSRPQGSRGRLYEMPGSSWLDLLCVWGIDDPGA